MQDSDTRMIGQFGLGFYSAFLVGNMVDVVSRSYADDKQHMWSSEADGHFSVVEDRSGGVSGEGELSRGTVVRIHLRSDSSDFLQEGRLHELVAQFSEYIRFPIYLLRTGDAGNAMSGASHVLIQMPLMSPNPEIYAPTYPKQVLN